MNKKFSTLVACAMLATSVGGAYAAKITTAITTSTVTPTALTGVAATGNASGGYQVGVSYLLGESTASFLAVTTAGKLEMTSVAPGTLAAANNALWTLQSIIAPEGALAPKYVFVNKTTGTLLAMDKSNATSFGANGTSITDPSKVDSKMAGGQTEWLSAASYKEPQTTVSAIYAAIPGDSVIALAKVNSGTAVYLAKMKVTELSAGNVVKIQPYKYSSGSEFLLSANDLNTMLGTAGNEAKDNSYFNLAFNPVATMRGADNLLAQDLQAVAVDQYEKAYGSDVNVVDNNEFASFYPLTNSASSSFKVRNEAENISFKQTDPLWLALKNRDNKYLVADTFFVDGTQQDANKRISFKMDGLYNAKNITRFRNPESYLFAFYYNPSTGTVRIQVKDFLNKKNAKFPTDFSESAFYEGPTAASTDDYSVAPVKREAEWYSDGVAAPGGNLASTSTTASPINNNYIIKAALGSVTEVTLGELRAADGTSNEFNIKVGPSKMYQAIYMPSNAYLLKIVASKNADRVGKYWINNLKGGFEVMEQAIRQNFQEMPAAQWIVKSSGTSAGSPVTIVNREFAQAPYSVISSGTLYGVVGASGQAFFMGEDTLQFIPVTKANDKYLGYKYVAQDTITESIFTFNYLHDLAMDKPINTKNDVDSVVWVDKDGQSAKFILEKVLEVDDTYGTNGGLTNVAQLVRRVYKVKVNDATKLQNDKRYLRYDEVQKKYVVSAKDASLADVFFLKENNEVDGGNCYYTLVKANLINAGTLENTVDANNYVTALTSIVAKDASTYVQDGDLYGWYQLTSGKVKNASGVWVDGNVPAIMLVGPTSTSLAYYYIPVTQAQLLEIWNISSLPTGYTQQTSPTTFNGVTYAEHVTNASNQVVCVIRLLNDYTSYANYKVSVDNNTLDLVNGVLNNQSSQEVATSSFAVVKDANPLYRRFNQAAEGIASDAPDTVKFYRVNSTVKEYLYEDANSVYSKGKDFNFLGVEGKGDNKLASMYVDTAYVARGTKMPQYMIALAPSVTKGDTVLCQDPNHKTLQETLDCYHTKMTRTYVDARYLVNLQDSVDVSKGLHQAKYQWNNEYTRLGFVDARHIGDSLIIKNSIYTGNNKPIIVGKAATWASKDTINLANNLHKNAVFSFRLLKTGSDDFLIESETNKDGKSIRNKDLEAATIAPLNGGWVKIQNGVPVIANTINYNEAGRDAEIFNVEATSEVPTANDAIDATTVSIVAGNGNVTIKNAEGKTVAISNILGQAIANTVITSDNATITVPTGIVVVSVEGEEAVKVIVK